MAVADPRSAPHHPNDQKPEAVERRVAEALAALSLEQKVRLLTGADFWSTHPEPAIGLRRMVLSDGPVGVRGELWDERDPSVSLPSPTALAATWDEALLERLGALLASEARRKGVDVVLGPTVNLHRSPLGGRHFECFSEDPLLTGRLGAAYVRGLQAHGVAATPKHYVANDAETDRFTVDVHVDERTLRELYLAPFERMIVGAGAWLVMASYNRVNGTTMTENALLASPLGDEWGFDGVVVSDWSATRSTEAAGRAALNLVMPGPEGPWGDALVAAVRTGAVPEQAIDDKVRRLLRLAARVGALEGVPPARPAPAAIPAAEAGKLARETAAAAMVLARNQGDLLPLDPASLRRVAVIGPSAARGRIQGGGSATVHPHYAVSPLDGLRAALGQRVEVHHALGTRIQEGLVPVTGEHVVDPVTGQPGVHVRLLDAQGHPLHEEHRDVGKLTYIGDRRANQSATIEVTARFRAVEAGRYRIGVAGVGAFRLTGGGRVLLDRTLVSHIDDLAAALLAPPQLGAELSLAAGQEIDLTLTHAVPPGAIAVAFSLGVEVPALPEEEELARAVELARSSDVAIVVVGTTERIESEGFDRSTLALPGGQDKLVRAVAAVNPRTVVLVNAGGPVTMPWRDEVAAVLLTWFPGQEFGNAVADVLLGAREPGGRLPTTWPAREEDVPVLSTKPENRKLVYAEGLHIGYRAWARAGVAPAYPFGHGLGYTRWEILGVDAPSDLAAGEAVEARVHVRNAGRRRGRHVVQLYLSRAGSKVERPALWLAGFAAVEAEPGKEAEVAVAVEPRAFAHWAAGGWQVEPGAYTLHVGPSAAELVHQTTVVLRG
ncbi:beta-glucosidase [Sorangium cellulosum]|uniref:Beta-glucosidase n=1 Tax=Sorangium cellulosum TaxID=56 RepID=A0A2L0F525_SORCE|nr:glycoside hydrolase family 3 C-terminal domain-containing protein [Sorangium cellulosum]AUX46675.1 beta-glucosidase [Sorangium cellulosum]